MMDCRKFTRSIALRFIVSVATVATFVMPGNDGFAQTLIPANSQAVVGPRLAPGMLNELGEEVVKRGTGFSAVLTLQDSSLETLIQTGRVEIEIPTQLINNVDSVIIKRPLYFKDKRASDFADTELAGQKLFLNVDDAVVERIDYQPVELKVYESGFTSVVLNYIGKSRSLRNSKEPGDAATDSPIMTVKLRSGKGIRGRIQGMKTLKIDSSIGIIDVPFARSKSISVRKDGELKIEMLNGDLISGSIDGGKIKLLNRWGTETIKMSDISTLTVRRTGEQKTRKQNREPVVNSGRVMDSMQISRPSSLNQEFSPTFNSPIR